MAKGRTDLEGVLSHAPQGVRVPEGGAAVEDEGPGRVTRKPASPKARPRMWARIKRGAGYVVGSVQAVRDEVRGHDLSSKLRLVKDGLIESGRQARLTVKEEAEKTRQAAGQGHSDASGGATPDMPSPSATDLPLGSDPATDVQQRPGL